MSVDQRIGELVGESVTSIEVDGLFEFGTIERTAHNRSRRRRGLGGLATMVVAMLAIVGAGVGLRDEPNAVFAGLDESEIPLPITVVDGPDGFVGIAPVRRPDLEREPLPWVMMQSKDGVVWTLIDDGPEFVGHHAMLAERDGRYTVVTMLNPESSGRAGQPDGLSFGFASSSDLVTWQQSEPRLFDGVGLEQRAFLTDMAMLTDPDDGVVVGLREAGPDLADAVIENGLLPSDICEYVIGPFSDQSPATIGLRVCGEREPAAFAGMAGTRPNTQLLQMNAGVVRPIELPDADAIQWQTSNNAIYQTETGVGVNGFRAYTTIDGRAWEPERVRDQTGVLYAPRGNEAVFTAWTGPARFGSNDPLWGLGYTDDGGETWQDVRIDETLDDGPDVDRYFHDLQAGEAGWVLNARLTVLPTEPPEGPAGRFEPFELTRDGFVLSGTVPFGPAELRTSEGELVEQWEHFEYANPEWSGLELTVEGVSVPAGPDAAILFTYDEWATLTGIGSGAIAQQTDLIFSDNGTDWRVIRSSYRFPVVLHIGDDHILVRWQAPHISGSDNPAFDRIERISVGDS